MIIESYIRAPALLNLLNLFARDMMLGKPRILSLFPNLFNNLNKTSTHVKSSIRKTDLPIEIMLSFNKIGYIFVGRGSQICYSSQVRCYGM